MFPADSLDLVVEAFLGGAWRDLSDRLDGRAVAIQRGARDGAAQVSAGSAKLLLTDDDGALTPHNPLSPWYPYVRRGVPVRIRVRRGLDAFGRSVSSGWGTAASGQVWTASGGSPSDYSVSGGVGMHSHGTVNFLRRTVLGTSLLDVEQLYDVSTPVLLTGAALVTGVLARYRDTSNYYWLRAEFNSGGTTVMLKITRRVGGVETELAALNPVPSLAYAAGVPLRVRARVDGTRLAIKAWTASGVEPEGWMLEVEDTADTALTAPGEVGLQSWLVGGNTNTLPVIVSFSNYQALVGRIHGTVGAYRPRIMPTTDGTVTQVMQIDVGGILRRLGQGSDADASPLHRYILAADPAAYYPAEEGIAADSVASAIPGQPPMTTAGVTEFTTPEEINIGTVRGVEYGTAALANLADGGSLAVNVAAAVTTATASAWTVSIASQIDASGTGITTDAVLLEIATPGGTFAVWRLMIAYATSETRVIGIRPDGTTATVINSPGVIVSFTLNDLSLWQSGGTIQVGLNYNHFSGTYDDTGSVAGTLAGITAIRVNPTGATSATPWPVGHVAVWASQPTPVPNGWFDGYGVGVWGPMLSHEFEAAHDRLARTADEDGVDVTMPSVPSGEEMRMGWQPASSRLDLYRASEAADGGVLYEARDDIALRYLPRTSRYNRPVLLTVDLATYQTASGTSGQVLAPIYDDQATRNDVTVSRLHGSSARAIDQDSIDQDGQVPDSVQLNLLDDSRLADIAAWRVHLGTVDEWRNPSLPLDLAGNPDLIDSWLSCDVGSRVQRTNVPPPHLGPIDQIIDGYTETLGPRSWTVTANCSPASPWDVATAVNPTQPVSLTNPEPRAPADGSTLAATLTTSAATLSLASTTANGVWSADIGTDYPLDIRVGGERVRVGVPGQQLVTDPWMAIDASNWVGAGATIARSITTTTLGYASLQITPDGSSASGGANTADRSAVTAGQTYLAGCWVYTTATITVGPAVDWWTATTGGSYISTGFVGPTSTAAGSWVWMSGVLTAPGTAAGAVMRARHSGTPPASSVWYATQLVLIPVTSYSTSPQTMTIAPSGRGINGVTRAWPSGTSVDVWFPAIAPL